MIISKHWLNEWVDLSEVSGETLSKTLNSIGLEVDSYKEINLPKSVVVGYVKSREKHPDADKLSVCQVDVGSETLQIVCGLKTSRLVSLCQSRSLALRCQMVLRSKRQS